MKKALFLSVIFLLSFSALSQTKIDELVSVKFPFTPEKHQSEKNNMILTLYSYRDKGESYTVQITAVDSTKVVRTGFPTDAENLKQYYKGVEQGIAESMQQSGLKFLKSEDFTIQGYLGKQVIYIDPVSEDKFVESRFLLLNERLYEIDYVASLDFSEQNKEKFLNSILIDSSKKPVQYIDLSSYRLGVLSFRLVVAALFFGALYLLIRYLRVKK